LASTGAVAAAIALKPISINAQTRAVAGCFAQYYGATALEAHY
jgi:hypothetical protein